MSDPLDDPYVVYAEAGRQLSIGRPDIALPILEALAEQGFQPSCVRLGNMAHYGKGVPVDLERATFYYLMASKKGHVLGLPFIFILRSQNSRWPKKAFWRVASIFAGLFGILKLPFVDKRKYHY